PRPRAPTPCSAFGLAKPNQHHRSSAPARVRTTRHSPSDPSHSHGETRTPQEAGSATNGAARCARRGQGNAAVFCRVQPGTWVTLLSGHMGDTLALSAALQG